MDSYFQYISWMHNPASLEDITKVYLEFYGVPIPWQRDSETPSPSAAHTISNIDLALLLAVLALGAQACPHRIEARRRNVLCEDYPNLVDDLYESSASLLSNCNALRNPSLTACKVIHLHIVSECHVLHT